MVERLQASCSQRGLAPAPQLERRDLFRSRKQETNGFAGSYGFGSVFTRLAEEEHGLQRHGLLHGPGAAVSAPQEVTPRRPWVRPVRALRVTDHEAGVVAQ